MRAEHGKVDGPLAVDDDFLLHGMVAGEVTVARGGMLDLNGMVTGDLKIQDGGSAVVRGIVTGDVLNAGNLDVYGMIKGRLSSTSEATTTIVPGAQINGEVH